jgi:hypothetical protein
MKAPKYQRADVLQAALREAVQTLNEPVDGIVVTDRGVVAWADGRHILMSYRWDNEYDAAGSPLPGSGAWAARYVSECAPIALQACGGSGTNAPKPPKRRAWWRLMQGPR